MSSWTKDDGDEAKSKLNIWPLDDYNIQLLDAVHPKQYTNPTPPHDNNDNETVYDFVAIGAGAGGLVSSRQAARRGATSAMISNSLAGGDCLNVGCVPSKALIHFARIIRTIRHSRSNPAFHFDGEVNVNFANILQTMRRKRAEIAPVDGHDRGTQIGVHVYQGFGQFVDRNTIEIHPPTPTHHRDDDSSSFQQQEESNVVRIKFKKAVIATGSRPYIPTDIPGLDGAPYTTNETLFNLSTLPKVMIILGSGVVALEMAQTFCAFGSKVIVLIRGHTLFPNSFDGDVGPTMQRALENDGVQFLTHAKIRRVETTIHQSSNNNSNNDGEERLPQMKVWIEHDNNHQRQEGVKMMECDCLLVAAGRRPNVAHLNLDDANVEFSGEDGIIVDNYCQSVGNSDVYSVGDCTAGVPRLTHMSGEMAKVVVENALFHDDWKLDSLVTPSCMYTIPEYASVGTISDVEETDVYTSSLKNNDRAILEDEHDDGGYVKVFCKKNTDTILGCTIIANRAGELINEVSLAMKYNIGLEQIGRNIHSYPTTGEAIMSCGLQLINSKWKLLHNDDNNNSNNNN